jgi:hypothetical protein
VWSAADLAADRGWEHSLSAGERAALVDLGHGVPGAAASLDPLVRRITEELATGRGLVLLHDFPVDQLDAERTAAAYSAFGALLGDAVPQTAAGDLITHIRDERLETRPPHVRLFRTNDRQDFHTDGADIITLLCLHAAQSGGESKVVSSGALYNHLLQHRPDLLDELYQPMCWHRQNEHKPGEQPWFELPVVHDLNGVPRIFYLGWYIRDAQEIPEVPRLTDHQLEAMTTLEQLANDPAFHVEMQFVPGDVQLINNGRVLHAREAYTDHPDPHQRRHLLRLWLAARQFASVDESLRTGITTS